MPITDLGITSEIKSDTTKLNLDEALAERETKSPSDTRPIQPSPPPMDEAEEGIQETGKNIAERTDDVIFAKVDRFTVRAVGLFNHSVFENVDPDSMFKRPEMLM